LMDIIKRRLLNHKILSLPNRHTSRKSRRTTKFYKVMGQYNKIGGSNPDRI
jgi:hypothetical protein